MILGLTAELTAAVHWARGSLEFGQLPPQITPASAAHFLVLLGIFFIQRAMSYWLARYALTWHTNGVARLTRPFRSEAGSIPLDKKGAGAAIISVARPERRF